MKAMSRVCTGTPLMVDVRAVERVGLPHFVGVGLGESQPVFVGAVLSGLSISYCLTSRQKVLGATCERVEALLRCTADRATRAWAFSPVDVWAAPSGWPPERLPVTTLRSLALVGARAGFP